MSIWLVVALCGLVLLMVVIYAACYVSGSVEDLERQAEFMALLMGVQGSNEADDAD